jgi:nitrite reductase (cytochrome c-552)
MAKQTAEDGTVTHSHYLASPLEDEELITTTCALCHNGSVQPELSVLVPAIQAQTEERTNAIGNQLAELTDQLAAAVESGKYTDEQFAEIRSLARDAQFYWDFVFVENSEGAHNSALSRQCMDKADALIDEAMALL